MKAQLIQFFPGLAIMVVLLFSCCSRDSNDLTVKEKESISNEVETLVRS